MSEARDKSIGMSVGAWISFGSLVIGMFISISTAVYWAGNHNAIQESQGRDIQHLMEADRNAAAVNNKIGELERRVGDLQQKFDTAVVVNNQLRVELARATGK